MRICLLVVLTLASVANARPPNIVIIFVDDMGYADVGCYGAQGFQTPNLDSMAQQGVRFTDFYVSQPVCSASRASLLTGCYANRVGISGALGPNAKHGINSEETTLAEVCKSVGYATAAFGKWHLGHLPEFLPTRHGFDEYYGTPYSNDMWPWHPSLAHFDDPVKRRKEGYPDLPMIEGEKIVDAEVTPEDQTRFTRDMTLRAIDFIGRNRDVPFFLYVAHPMPHVPLFTSPAFEGSSEQGTYGDVVQEIDWSVGQILATIDRYGLEEDTLVIFASDNGPWLSYGNHAGSALPLREGKGTTFDGGVRVPCIMRWTGTIAPGSEVSEPLMTIDILPTVAGLIGADLPERKIDGKDVWAHIVGRPDKQAHEALFFYYHNNHLEAMRSGRWKLHFPHGYRSMIGRELGADGSPGKYDHSVKAGLELYDLEADIGETNDLAADRPEVVERLLEMAEAMREELGDKLSEREGSARRPAGRAGQ